MTSLAENPFRKGFVVDVHVQYVEGKPRQYTVLDLHEVVDIDDDTDEHDTVKFL